DHCVRRRSGSRRIACSRPCRATVESVYCKILIRRPGGPMRSLATLLSFLLAACTTTTSVVMLDPAAKHPPTASVEILLKPPERPYVEIAKLESRGVAGEPETSVLEDARERARRLGADAIIVQESVD